MFRSCERGIENFGRFAKIDDSLKYRCFDIGYEKWKKDLTVASASLKNRDEKIK